MKCCKVVISAIHCHVQTVFYLSFDIIHDARILKRIAEAGPLIHIFVHFDTMCSNVQHSIVVVRKVQVKPSMLKAPTIYKSFQTHLCGNFSRFYSPYHLTEDPVRPTVYTFNFNLKFVLNFDLISFHIFRDIHLET